MGFFEEVFGSDEDGAQKYDVTVQQPSLAGKFADAGLPERAKPQRIYASPETRAQMAEINEKLLGTTAELTNADNVIFVSKSDITPAIRAVDEAHGMGGMNVAHNKDYPYFGEAFDKFRQQFSDPPPVILPGSAMDAYNEDASSTFYMHENGQSYAVITLPDLHSTAEEHFRSMAHVKSFMASKDGEIVKNPIHIKESEALDKAVIASDILHEAGHSGLRHVHNDADDAVTLGHEQEADAISAKVTPYLFPDVGDEAVQLNQDARAIGAMFLDDHDHDTNLDLHNNKSVTTDHQIDSITSVNKAVVEQVAKDTGTNYAEAQSLLDSDPALEYATLDKLNQSGSFKDDPVSQKYVDDFIAAGERRIPEYLGMESQGSTAPQDDAGNLENNNSGNLEPQAPLPPENTNSTPAFGVPSM